MWQVDGKYLTEMPSCLLYHHKLIRTYLNMLCVFDGIMRGNINIMRGNINIMKGNINEVKWSISMTQINLSRF